MLRIPTQYALLVLISAVAATHAPVDAQEDVVIAGKVVTGFNQYLGQPFIDFGSPLSRLSYAALGRHGAGGETPLTTATPNNALLATTLDPQYLELIGLNAALVDPTLLNVPLRDVTTNILHDGTLRLPLPGSDGVGFADGGQHGSATPIDLETWKRARGIVTINCRDESSLVVLKARNLLPHRLYSVWGNYFRPDFPAGEVPLQATAIGGLPNVFVTDEDGRGTFERSLNGCPLAADEFDRRLMSIDLLFHSDHQLNGSVPSIPLVGSNFFRGGRGVGAVVHPHLTFNVNGTELLTPEGWGDSGTCRPSSTVHCFRDGRFRVEIDWKDFSSQSGSGQAVICGSDDTGSFFFFNPDNIEVLVKVLDGCSFNNHFWVFASATTNVEYNLTVTDTQTSRSQIYSNPLGQASPAITDTNAFATCP